MHVLDEFEVSIFLTETDTRHSLLYKHKHFRDKIQTKLTSNSTKLIGESREAPIDVDGDFPQGDTTPVLIREESEDNEAIVLDNIPTIDETESGADTSTRQSKRRRHGQLVEADGSNDGVAEVIDSDDPSEEGGSGLDDEASSGSNSSESWQGQPPSKRRKEAGVDAGLGLDSASARDDKKKLAMDISYEGFAIYGRVLCLVVRRIGARGGTAAQPSGSSNKSQPGPQTGQASMENWITSTQIPAAGEGDESEA